MRVRGLALALAAVAVAAPLATAHGNATKSRATGACTAWHARTLLSGQGWLESLAFDGRGSLTLSALSQGKLLELKRGGQVKTLLDGVASPGGQVRRGSSLYFNTGDTLPLAAAGTVDRLDLRSGKRSTLASGLTMPNGLAFLPNGDAVTSGAVPDAIGLTRIPAHDPGHPQQGWAKVGHTNGLGVDPSGRWLYVDRDPPASTGGEVDRVQIAHPSRVQVVGRLGKTAYADDLTIDAKGILYVASFGDGRIYRLDPVSHRSCAIASGLPQATDVAFGGVGWHAQDLYVTSADGHLYQLTPPRVH